MKKSIALVFLTVVMGAVVTTSCKPVGSNKEETASVADTINSMMADIIRYAGQLNSDSTFKYLSNDSSAVYMSEGMYYSYPLLTSAFRTYYGATKSQQLETVFSKVEVPAPGVAVWIGCTKSICTDKMDQVMELYLCETWIWQRKSDGWKVIHYNESSRKMPSQEQKSVVETALGKLAAELVSKSLQPADIKPVLTSFLKQNPSVYGTTLAFEPAEVNGVMQKAAPYFYRSGNEIKEAEISDAYDYTTAEWYSAPVKTKAPCWSKPYFDDGAGGIVMITYSVPIYSRDNRLIGVLTSDLPM